MPYLYDVSASSVAQLTLLRFSLLGPGSGDGARARAAIARACALCGPPGATAAGSDAAGPLRPMPTPPATAAVPNRAMPAVGKLPSRRLPSRTVGVEEPARVPNRGSTAGRGTVLPAVPAAPVPALSAAPGRSGGTAVGLAASGRGESGLVPALLSVPPVAAAPAWPSLLVVGLSAPAGSAAAVAAPPGCCPLPGDDDDAAPDAGPFPKLRLSGRRACNCCGAKFTVSRSGEKCNGQEAGEGSLAWRKIC